jgi:hypothetical protein
MTALSSPRLVELTGCARGRVPLPHRYRARDGTLIRFWCRSLAAPIVFAIPQHDPPHRTAGAVDPGQQFCLPVPARPPQPSWRMRSRMSRIGMSPWGMCVSEIIRSLPQRSHTMRRNHDGKARSGSSKASAPDGSGSLPVAAPVPSRGWPGRHQASGGRLPVAWRTSSRNKASAASPRCSCSSSVISGTSPSLPRRCGFFAASR